jgi:hypothetical protein
MPGIGVEAPKRKRVKNVKISEADQRSYSFNDSFKLFGAEMLANVSEQVSTKLQNWLYIIQNSRHYKKLPGDGLSGFDLIRDPMYKYSKLVKEKFFKDNVMSFLWVFYRAAGNDDSTPFQPDQDDDE